MPLKGGFIAGLSTEAVICSVAAALHRTRRGCISPHRHWLLSDGPRGSRVMGHLDVVMEVLYPA